MTCTMVSSFCLKHSRSVVNKLQFLPRYVKELRMDKLYKECSLILMQTDFVEASFNHSSGLLLNKTETQHNQNTTIQYCVSSISLWK